MTVYSCKIQYSEHYPDEFVEKGNVDKDKAIDEFQLYPWEKEMDDFRRNTNYPMVPKIIFNSDDGRQLAIESTSYKGFDAEYRNLLTNKYSSFYISNDFGKKNYAPEEIIEFFFDNVLEKHLKLQHLSQPEMEECKPKEKRKPKNMEFVFNPNHLKILGFNTFMWMSISISCFIFLPKEKVWWLIHLVFAYCWIPSFILHLAYYLKNRSAKVIIDTKNHELTYSKDGKEIKFNRDDISRCQLVYAKSGRSSWINYSYVWFLLKNNTRVVITSLITDPEEIVEALKCKFETDQRTIPFLG